MESVSYKLTDSICEEDGYDTSKALIKGETGRYLSDRPSTWLAEILLSSK